MIDTLLIVYKTNYICNLTVSAAIKAPGTPSPSTIYKKIPSQFHSNVVILTPPPRTTAQIILKNKPHSKSWMFGSNGVKEHREPGTTRAVIAR